MTHTAHTTEKETAKAAPMTTLDALKAVQLACSDLKELVMKGETLSPEQQKAWDDAVAAMGKIDTKAHLEKPTTVKKG